MCIYFHITFHKGDMAMEKLQIHNIYNVFSESPLKYTVIMVIFIRKIIKISL